MEKKMINIQDIEDVLTENGIEISEKIGKKTKIFLELNVDSLTIMTVFCVIEEKYNINFSEEDLDFNEEFTVEDLIGMINNKL
jgi:acyl carrier protein